MLPREDFDTCDPVSWWVGRHSQFPDLFVFARDLLAIPGQNFLDICLHQLHMFNIKTAGSAVAVERIFSGGQDTISLQRASLCPEMIWTLMLVKQHLCVT